MSGNNPSSPRAQDISGSDPSAIVKTWAIIGCLFLAFMLYVIFNWVTAPYFGPTHLPDHVEVPLNFKIGVWTVTIGMGLVWAYFIWTQIITPIRQNGQPNTLGLMGCAFFVAIFWDPSMNWIQQGCVYNAYALNLGFLSGEIPGWMSPRGNLLPEPLLAWAGGYPGFLIWMTLTGLATMRFTKKRFPNISNVKLAAIGIVGSMVADMVLESLLIRFSGIYAYPGSIRAVSLWGGHWYQFPIYEALLFGGWVGTCSVLLYFKDDKGRTWVERGVEKIDMCKESNFRQTAVRFMAILGFCQVIEVILYVLPMPLLTANADPFPEDLPEFFTVGSGMCGPGTGLVCARPDQPIIRRNDLEKFKDTPQISHEEAMTRLAK
ncbi:MAG: spirocyclase AveC family protein [Pseudomonadales bacterium]|nr:spirocyclase AveC family protein [Pseudomonadales bacterium]